MPYPVPRFIKEETKLMGLVNFTQLTILVCLGGLIILLFYTVQRTLFFILTAFLLTVGLAITFGKLYEIPIYKLVGSMFRYIWLPKEYLFEKQQLPSKPPVSSKKTESKQTGFSSSSKTLDSNTLKQLTDILNQ